MRVRVPLIPRIVLTLLATAVALCAAVPAARAATYAVEVVIFENAAGDGDDELWRPDLPGDGPSTPAGLPGDISFHPVEGLARQVASLERSSAYRLLQSLAWEQSLAPRRNAPVIPLGLRQTGSAAGTPSALARLSGSVRVYGDTYLFIDLDVVYRAGEGSDTSGTTFGSRYAPSVRYRIDERRRVKLNEIHYFDHPRFGALVQVRTVK